MGTLLSLRSKSNKEGSQGPLYAVLLGLGMIAIQVGVAQDYQRDLITQFESSRDFLRRHLRLIRTIGRDERTEELEIPLVALGEALANALVHREYANQTSPVYIDIFKDSVEICSPGTPPDPMTLELLEEKHISHPRNPQIARIFYLCKYVDKVGSGIQRMQDALVKWQGCGLRSLN